MTGRAPGDRGPIPLEGTVKGLDMLAAAELEALPQPQRGPSGGWWFNGVRHAAMWQAVMAREALAAERAERRRAHNAWRDRQQAEYFARRMSPATSRSLRPGDVYSIPATHPPFAYREFTVAGEPEHLDGGATLVRHVRQTDDPDEQDCLLHPADLFLYRRPAGA